MPSEKWKVELNGMSPWQVTQAVKDYMSDHDIRMNISFAYACPSKSELEEGQEDCLWLKQTTWKSYTQKKIDDTEYVKLR